MNPYVVAAAVLIAWLALSVPLALFVGAAASLRNRRG